jgi:DNA-binding NtrC family response regulator
MEGATMNEATDPMIEYRGALLKVSWVQAVDALVAQLADGHVMVLIRGEHGTGKNLMARLIHAASARQHQPFIRVRCAGPSAEHLASELFGHERGAVPDAVRRKPGRFEFANHGTLLVENVEALPPALQAPLRRVLEGKEFYRLGGREPIRVDVCAIGTTTQTGGVSRSGGDLWEECSSLRLVDMHIPPLRERRDEIPGLAAFFLAQLGAQYHRPAELPGEILRLFAAYFWPGNIRQLQEMVRRLVVTGDPRSIHEEIRPQLHQMGPDADTLRSA